MQKGKLHRVFSVYVCVKECVCVYECVWVWVWERLVGVIMYTKMCAWEAQADQVSRTASLLSSNSPFLRLLRLRAHPTSPTSLDACKVNVYLALKMVATETSP